MPYRSTTYRSSSYRRPTYRKRVYRKKWSRRAPRKFTNDGKRFFKLRTSLPLSSNVGGQIQQTITDGPTVFSDWTSISQLFDSFRVCAIKIKFIPDMPNDTSTVTGYRPLYVVHDPDSTTMAMTPAAAIEYENMKVFNMFRPWTYYKKMTKQSASGVVGQVMLPGGYKDVAVPTSSQGIFMIGEGFDISTQYGQIIVTGYITAKNRR